MFRMREISPAETLQLLTGGYLLARCVQVVADLGVADHIDSRPVAVTDLASKTGSEPEALNRVMSLLSAHGIFDGKDGEYVHTPASRLLRSDDPQSMRSFVRMFGLPFFWQAAMRLDQAVKTGRQVGHDVHPGGIFGYFAENAGAGQIFNEAMTAKAHALIPAILSSYGFSRFNVVGDIGGGQGHLIRGILASNPGLKGILFDLPNVIHGSSSPSANLELQSGDFFKDKLPVCDVYVLMEVIHDWPDAESRAILQAVRRAAPASRQIAPHRSRCPCRSWPLLDQDDGRTHAESAGGQPADRQTVRETV